jgi:signal transduction histidine kinase
MRRRILTTVAATTVLVLLAFLLPLAVLVQTVAESRATTAATLRIQPLIPLVSIERQSLIATVEQVNADGGYPVTVFMPGGATIGVPAEPTDTVELAGTGVTVTADSDLGREIAVPVLGLEQGTAVIRVLVPADELKAGVTRARLSLVGLGVILLLLALAVGDALARSFVRPAEALAATAEQLAAGDLNARVKPGGPRETRSVGVALNRLAARIGDLLVAEREAVADLSHRLRTPVTALRLDADSLRDPAERERMTSDVEQLSRTVDAVILEARRPVREGMYARCDATAVLAERASFWSALADDEDRDLSLDLPQGPLEVRCSAADLAATVDALLGNVFAHTPEGTGFTVTLVPHPVGGAVLRVDDDGPGWPSDLDIERRGVSTAGSTGLGLDIAGTTAAVSGGSMQVERSSSGGARVVVQLGAPLE